MGGKPPNTEDKFWSMSRRTEAGCREWLGLKTPKGYGQWSWKGKNIRVNRLAWELANKQPIPKGMIVMHACDNPACVNPSHLRLGTVRENNLNMVKKGRLVSGYGLFQSRKTHCKNGHPLTPENIKIYFGVRKCLVCEKERGFRLKEAKRSLLNFYPNPRLEINDSGI